MQGGNAKPNSWWQQIKQHRVAIEVVGIVLVVVIALIIAGYRFDWAGFNGYNKVTIAYITSGPSAGTVTRTEEYQLGKTFWDWLQLLIIPAVLAVGGFWLNQLQKSREDRVTEQQAELERERTRDNQHETLLQAYIDKMAELLEKHLRESQPEDEARKIARTRTLIVLSRLDSKRKGSILQFLSESGLISKGAIDLHGADLSNIHLNRANLSGASLSKGDLSKVKLYKVDLSGANLSGANLHEAILSGANLSGANLSKAILAWVHLVEANLSGANLSEVYLCGANLSGANLSDANLSGANLSEVYLCGANLSGTIIVGTSLRKANLSRTAYWHNDGFYPLSELWEHAAMYRSATVETEYKDNGYNGSHLTVIYKGGANLSGANLSTAYLSDADLSDADLSGADLSGADLSGANLSRANLKGANLTRAIMLRPWITVVRPAGYKGNDKSHSHSAYFSLTRADLENPGADLENPDLVAKPFLEKHYGNDADLQFVVKELKLNETTLQEADFTDANFTDVLISDQQLSKAKSLQGAIMPDGSTHP